MCSCSAMLGDTASLQASATAGSYRHSAPSDTKIPEPRKEEKKMPHLGPSIPQSCTLCILVTCSLLCLSLATASRSFSDKGLELHPSEWGQEQRWNGKAFPGYMVLGQVSGGFCLCLSIRLFIFINQFHKKGCSSLSCLFIYSIVYL